MKIAVITAAALLSLGGAGTVQAAGDTVNDCHLGAYRLADGDVLSLNPSDTDLTFRWRKLDGVTGKLTPQPDGSYVSTIGWTDHRDGRIVRFSDCASGQIDFAGAPAQKIPLDVTNVTFESGGLKLAGRLVMPKGSGRVPIVVMIHGSEKYSGRDIYYHQWMLPANGVGVFVYDKRGTGQSEGKYTQDFETLSNDAVAAMAQARKLAGARAGRVGFQGGSQGGWVAPLAATKTHADFVISDFGLLVDPLEEDREEIMLEMRNAGHSPQDTAKALEIADAAGEIVTSGLKHGFERFDALRAKYRGEPWYKDLHGNFTGFLLPYSKDELLAHRNDLEMGTPWHYDGMAVQAKLMTPQLWELGTDDLAAPSAETAKRLKSFMAKGHPITLAMFPRSEHGIYEYELKPDGSRVDTRNADGYLKAMIDYAKTGRLSGRYGDATITTPKDVKR
ncbi:MAG: alpha/beta hydrolase [Elusimicrobia bacterium]|nr:alpha/beta hydrolase [Elusimicrobiota bacterium]